MSLKRAWMLLVSLLFGVGFVGRADAEEQAVAELKKLGGSCQVNAKGQVWWVTLVGPKVTDAGLKHLKGLSNLRHLGLGSQVTDAGLKHLKGLTKLRELYLSGTQVTDAGLEHLKGLTGLNHLNLDNTKVTDAGLEHLKGLSNLRSLSLGRTPVTGAGVNELKKALPKCHVTH